MERLRVRPSGPLPDLDMIKKVFEDIPHCQALGMKIIELRHGKGFMAVEYDKKLIGNPKTGVVHGGVITALLDTLCGVVVMSAIPENTPLATLDLRIDYLHPATPGEVIRASAECYKLTGHVAFVRGLAYHDVAGDPIANCTGAFMLAATGFAPKTSPGKTAANTGESAQEPKGGEQPC